MTALYIILGIIAFFVIVLSIPVVLDLEYTDAVQRRSQKRRKKKNRSPRRKISSRPFTIIRAWRELSSFSTTAWRHLNDSRSNSLSVPL